MAILFYCLSALSFLVGIFFFVKTLRIERRMRKRQFIEPERQPSEVREQTFEEKVQAAKKIMEEAKAIAKALGEDNPNPSSDAVLIQILNELKRINVQVRDVGSQVRDVGSQVRELGSRLSGLIYFVSGVIVSVELLIIGFLWAFLPKF